MTNDLISRQAAIDAINKAFERVFAWDGTDPLGDKVLENVPSAQPQITHCAECRHWKHSDVRKNYCEVFDWVNTAEDFCSFAERKENR